LVNTKWLIERHAIACKAGAALLPAYLGEPSMSIEHDSQCLFCKIIAGDIPCHKIYEDDEVLAFLDIGPLSKGHCLIIPKYHAVTLDALPDNFSAACGRVFPRISRAIKKTIGTHAWNLLQNNGRLAHQEIDHVHFHIIPRNADQGLGIQWRTVKLNDADAMTQVKAISCAIEKDSGLGNA